MKPGSVVVDLAAETGGNIETTRPGEIYVHNGVTHIGLTDLPSRLPTQSSTLYANNISKFLLSLGKNLNRSLLSKIKIIPGEKNHFHINLSDEVVRGSIVLYEGQLMWPPPRPIAPPAPAAPVPAAAPKKAVEPVIPNYFNNTLKDAALYTAGMSEPKTHFIDNNIFLKVWEDLWVLVSFPQILRSLQ